MRYHRFRAALAACLVLAPAQARADRVTPPSVPTDLRVEAGHRPYLVGHAVGTQNYVCVFKNGAFAWIPFGPQATLFDDDASQITTHFLSPNPDEAGEKRATWQHSRDTSAVWAKQKAISSDAEFVAPGAIPWLLLEVVGREPGPDGGRRLTATTFIQRVHTSGGVAPTTGCADPLNIGDRALVPYTTDYYFYKAHGH